MSADNRQDQLQAQVRTLQIIISALAAGSGIFAAIVVFQTSPDQWNGNISPLTLIALIFSGSTVFIRLIVPSFLMASGRQGILRQRSASGSGEAERESNAPLQLDDITTRQLLGLLSLRTIIAGALMESPIFFLLVVTLVEHSWITISLAALLWLLLIAHFPTRGWAEQWFENQWRLLEEEHSLRR